MLIWRSIWAEGSSVLLRWRVVRRPASVRPSLTFHICDFFSKTAERNSTKLVRKQDLNVLYNVCVFRADRTNKMAALASDLLRHFRINSSLKPLNGIQRNLTGSKISMSSTQFVFLGPIGKTRWPPWPLIGWVIFDFSSETAKQNSMKLDKMQDHIVLYQVCVFRAVFHPSYWNPRKTDGQTTCHFTLRIGIHVRRTEGQIALISPPPPNWKKRKTDRRTNYISFHPSYWNLRKTNRDKLHFFSPSYWDKSKTDSWTNCVSFHPSCWRLRQTDGHTMDHSTPHVEIQVRQTHKLHFFSPLILESKHDKQTDKLRFISSLILESKQDRQTKLRLISPLVLGSKADGRLQSTYVSFHPSFWDKSKTDGQIFFFYLKHLLNSQTIVQIIQQINKSNDEQIILYCMYV